MKKQFTTSQLFYHCSANFKKLQDITSYDAPALAMDGLVQLATGKFRDNKDHKVNMGPTWVLSAPARPHVGPMNLVIGVSFTSAFFTFVL